jgi:hypothetical protein
MNTDWGYGIGVAQRAFGCLIVPARFANYSLFFRVFEVSIFFNPGAGGAQSSLFHG